MNKLILGFVICTSIFLSYSVNAVVWTYYPIHFYNDTNLDMVSISADHGCQAQFTSFGKTSILAGMAATLEDSWQYTGKQNDNNNTSELFFTWNGTNYCLQQKGYRNTNTYMYIRFAQGGLTSPDGKLTISRVEYQTNVSGATNESDNDGYNIGMYGFNNQ